MDKLRMKPGHWAYIWLGDHSIRRWSTNHNNLTVHAPWFASKHSRRDEWIVSNLWTAASAWRRQVRASKTSRLRCVCSTNTSASNQDHEAIHSETRNQGQQVAKDPPVQLWSNNPQKCVAWYAGSNPISSMVLRIRRSFRTRSGLSCSHHPITLLNRESLEISTRQNHHTDSQNERRTILLQNKFHDWRSEQWLNWEVNIQISQ